MELTRTPRSQAAHTSSNVTRGHSLGSQVFSVGFTLSSTIISDVVVGYPDDFRRREVC